MKTQSTCSIFLVMFSVMACRIQVEKSADKSEAKQGSGNVTGTSNELDGTWRITCTAELDSKGVAQSFKSFDMTFSGTKATKNLDAFSDRECKNKIISMRITGTMESGKILTSPQGAKSFDFTPVEYEVTHFAAEAVNTANYIGECGGGWVLGKKRIISKDTCSKNDEAFKDSFLKTYDIYKIQDGSLYMGQSDASDPNTDGTSPEKRPKEFQTSFVRR